MKMIRCGVAVQVVVLATSLVMLVGCAAATGAFKGQTTAADATLSSKNYKVVKVGAKGESSGFSLLCFTINSPSYAKAKEALYASIGERLEGRAIALVNVTEDRDPQSVILFATPKLTITADVIEFDR
jgi:hypothetical protein